MADIFISYSRNDRARVEAIARALEGEGYSVWWDPDIRPGETYDEVIERELRAAACVIVAWSQTSVQSKWVRSEATEADERRVLVPVRLDQARVPLAFKLVQTEDLTGWQGDRQAHCWQRIMLQAAALCGKGSDSAGPTRVETLAALPAHSSAPSSPTRSDPGRRSTSILTISAVLILAAAWVLGAADRSPVITATVVLAALAFLLFRLAEDDLSPGVKAIARRWMLPVEGKVEVSAIEAFNGMFEAVFGRKHFSWFCLWRSAVTSTVFFAVAVVVIDYFFFNQKLISSASGGYVWLFVLGLAFIGITWNVIGDYLSLFETRLVLRSVRRRPNLLLIAVLVDGLLTGMIFHAAVGLSVFAFDLLAGQLSLTSFAKAGNVMSGFAAYLAGFGQHTGDGMATIAYASFATAYLTSIWLWLALIFTPIVRLVVWSRTTGLTAIGRILDAENRPMIALGYVTALLILACGAITWGVGHAIAAAAR